MLNILVEYKVNAKPSAKLPRELPLFLGPRIVSYVKAGWVGLAGWDLEQQVHVKSILAGECFSTIMYEVAKVAYSIEP